MLSHEAHHRGHVCMLAHQLGFPLPNKVAYGIWNREELWKELRVVWRPRLRFLRNRSRAQAARRWAAMVETAGGGRWVCLEAPGAGGQKRAQVAVNVRADLFVRLPE